jgi:hypothetical protein
MDILQLLRLRRYCLGNIPQLNWTSESESYVTTDSQSASLSWNKAPIWGLTTTFLLLSDNCRFVNVGWSLWRENGSVVYNCWWRSPAQQYRWTRDHILLSQIWDYPFRRLLQLAGLRWRYSTPPPHGRLNFWLCSLLITSQHGPWRNTQFPLL